MMDKIEKEYKKLKKDGIWKGTLGEFREFGHEFYIIMQECEDSKTEDGLFKALDKLDKYMEKLKKNREQIVKMYVPITTLYRRAKEEYLPKVRKNGGKR